MGQVSPSSRCPPQFDSIATLHETSLLCESSNLTWSGDDRKRDEALIKEVLNYLWVNWVERYKEGKEKASVVLTVLLILDGDILSSQLLESSADTIGD